MYLLFTLAQGIKHLHNRNKHFPEDKLVWVQRGQPSGGWWLWVLGANTFR